MPEFTNEIAELNERNRKIEANRQKKRRRKKNLRRNVLLLQSICLILSLAAFLLRFFCLIPVWLGFIVCLACSLCSVYLWGYCSGYEDAAV